MFEILNTHLAQMFFFHKSDFVLSRVVNVSKKGLPHSACGTFPFQMVEQIDGWCWCKGGQTMALERPIPTLEDIFFDVVMKLKQGEFKDNRFLLGVANNVRFYGFPEAFVPRSYR